MMMRTRIKISKNVLILEDVLDNILFICIGDSNIVGDSLGPLIGSFIKKNKALIQTNNNIDIIGTMECPIGYSTITSYMKNNDNAFRVIIDSALGSKENIGKIIIDNSRLCAGRGINHGKYLYGDVAIRGIIGKNHYNKVLNAIELRDIPAIQIDKMANKIISAIIPFLARV